MFQPEFIQLLLQIPMVGAFIFFALRMMENNQKANEKRDERYENAIRELRDVMNIAISGLKVTVDNNTDAMNKLNTYIIQHDARTAEYIKSDTERSERHTEILNNICKAINK